MSTATPRLDRLADHLADALVDRVAERLAEIMAEQQQPKGGEPLIDAIEVARRLGRSRAYVYEHRRELGAIPLGPQGEDRRPRLGFDPARIDAYLAAPEPEQQNASTSNGNGRRRRSSTVELLPVKGRS